MPSTTNAESSLTFNCDSAASVRLTDSGNYKLHYKLLNYKKSSRSLHHPSQFRTDSTDQFILTGIHTLGRFECTGQVTVFGHNVFFVIHFQFAKKEIKSGYRVLSSHEICTVSVSYHYTHFNGFLLEEKIAVAYFHQPSNRSLKSTGQFIDIGMIAQINCALMMQNKLQVIRAVFIKPRIPGENLSWGPLPPIFA